MNNSGIAIKYGDIAPEAKENFVPSVTDKESFVDLSQLQKYNLNFPNYGNPCDLYSVALDGKTSVFPSDPGNKNLGLWSEQTTDENGDFETPIVLTLTSDGQYSSQGFTFTFDTLNQIYPTEINIHWWRDLDGSSADLGEEDFYPNNALYFCRKQVQNYNRVVVTFPSLNMPKNRLKLRAIDYGYGTVFYGDELRNVALLQEVNPISSEISINTADFTLDSKRDIEYSFQEKQPLSIFFNGELKATTFIKKSKRKSKFLWDIQSEDYIGFLDAIPYPGGIYSNENAVDVLTDIFTVAKVPFEIDNVFEDETITGYIPYTTCRDALMQVAFAIQAVVDTSNSNVIKVFALDEGISQTILLERIMQGQDFDEEETVTGVEVAVHTYKRSTESVDAYDASESGAGQNILVKFNEPLYGLSITNGTIVSSGTNYAIINANASCLLRGLKYEHTTYTRRKDNPVISANEIERILAIDNATLVSAGNIDNIIGRCYNWLTKTRETNVSIIEGKHQSFEFIKYGQKKYGEFKYSEEIEAGYVYDQSVGVGETIEVATEYLGNIVGKAYKQSFNLNGGIIVKKIAMR